MPEFRQVIAPYGVWALAMLGVMLLAGAALGSLRAWRTALGDNRVVRQRRVIALAIGAVGIGVTTVVLAPVSRGLPVSANAALGFAAGSLVLALIPLTRPLACAIAMAEVLGAFAASIAIDLRVVRVPVPDSVAVAVGVVLAATAAISGWMLGRGLASGVTKRAEMTTGAKAMLTRSSDRLRPMARQVTKWTLVIAGVGAAVAALVGRLSPSTGANPIRLWVVIAVVAAAPLVLLGAAVLAWFWLGWWLAPATEWFLGGVSVVAGSARWVDRRMRRLLVLWRYSRSLCDQCLRWSDPLDSIYRDGHRTCEKCGGEISFAGGPGKLVVVAGDQPLPDRPPERVFLRMASDIVSAADPVDVTHLRLDASDALAPDVEHLVMFLSNEEPSHGLERVEAYAVRGRAALPAAVSNLVSNHMTWTDVDPLSEATPRSRLERLWARMAREPDDAPQDWPLRTKVKRTALGAAIGALTLLVPRLLLSLLSMPYVFTTYEWGRQLTYHDATGAVVRPSLWELTWHLKFPLAAVLGAVVLLGAALLVSCRLWARVPRQRHAQLDAHRRPQRNGDSESDVTGNPVERGRSAPIQREPGVWGVVLAPLLIALAGVAVVLVYYLLPALWIASASASFVVVLALDWLFSAAVMPESAWISWAVCGAALGAGLGFCSLTSVHAWRRREVLSMVVPAAIILMGAFVLPGHVVHAPPPLRSYIVGPDQTVPVVSGLHRVRVRRGDRAVIGLRVDDPFDEKVRLTVRVMSVRGKVMLTARGTVATGVRVRVRFRCRLKPGTYVYRVTAKDAEGNASARASTARLRVL